MEGVESALLAGVQGPGLVTIQQRAEYAGLVHFHLSADGQHLFPRRASTAAAFPIRFFQFGV